MTKLKAPLFLKAKGSRIRLPPKVEAKARESPLRLNKKDLTGVITVKPHLTQRTIAVPSLIRNLLLPKVKVRGRTLHLRGQHMAEATDGPTAISPVTTPARSPT